VLDITDVNMINQIMSKHKISQVYHLAAILSASGEKNPFLAWQVNMSGLLNILEACVTNNVKKVFFPSTIAVFGPTTPRVKAPQQTVTEPVTIYGISKLAGEGWCNYYFQKENLDVRCLRYPGLISYNTRPGGGTTDYAVDIFYEAVQQAKYECFLKKDTTLPMMYMPDAIRGTLELMNAPADKISIRTGYNFSGFSFSPEQIADEIKKHIPAFEIDYLPDYRQELAASWPQSIDDSVARHDWNWKPEFNLASTTEDMLRHISADANH
jgi:nucleoside-diphosphate-sugar epimerase